jgi:hypothetical protein
MVSTCRPPACSLALPSPLAGWWCGLAGTRLEGVRRESPPAPVAEGSSHPSARARGTVTCAQEVLFLRPKTRSHALASCPCPTSISFLVRSSKCCFSPWHASPPSLATPPHHACDRHAAFAAGSVGERRLQRLPSPQGGRSRLMASGAVQQLPLSACSRCGSAPRTYCRSIVGCERASGAATPPPHEARPQGP